MITIYSTKNKKNYVSIELTRRLILFAPWRPFNWGTNLVNYKLIKVKWETIKILFQIENLWKFNFFQINLTHFNECFQSICNSFHLSKDSLRYEKLQMTWHVHNTKQIRQYIM